MLLCVAIQFRDLIRMCIGVTVHKVEIRTFSTIALCSKNDIFYFIDLNGIPNGHDSKILNTCSEIEFHFQQSAIK